MIHQIRVIFGDTDQMGVVYYANYLRYFESARSALLRASGITGGDIAAHDVQFPVAEASCRYRRPAHYEDLLDIEIAITELGHARIRFDYTVRRGGDVLANGHTVHACIDPTGRPRRIPPELRAILAASLG